MLQIEHLSYAYGDRVALDDVSLDVRNGELFGFLGPNGSGKTTLFRILATILPPGGGTVKIGGFDLATQRNDVRRLIGVMFQSPSLDIHLTAAENLRHHGHLYGLKGTALRDRIAELLGHVRLEDRANDRVKSFSGGMRRRLELAKALLPGPRVLLLDEPSTGLDLTARMELRQSLLRLRDSGVTILLTTHLVEEADACDRLAIIDRGRLIACDTPDRLRGSVGGDVITLLASDPAPAAERVRRITGVEPQLLDGRLRIEHPSAAEWVAPIAAALGSQLQQISLGKPTLADVFAHLTGRPFEAAAPAAVSSTSAQA
jgi:ABC-2 type transport system ATP-binding protein